MEKLLLFTLTFERNLNLSIMRQYICKAHCWGTEKRQMTFQIFFVTIRHFLETICIFYPTSDNFTKMKKVARISMYTGAINQITFDEGRLDYVAISEDHGDVYSTRKDRP